MNKSEKGFTLIELMIVIAIIAIIAAIAIPGLLQSQRASNERNASASLKTVTTAQADFRANDRDANRIQDFWVGNMAGLFSLVTCGTSDMIKLIDIGMAAGDYNHTVPAVNTNTAVVAAVPAAAVNASTGTYVNPTGFAVQAPKAGYWYRALVNDDLNVAYCVDTSGVTDTAGGGSNTGGRNHGKYGFIAFPDSFSSGRSMFVVNEGNTVFKRQTIANVRPTNAPPSNAALLPAGYTGAAVSVTERWPTDANLKAFYAKLD